MNSYLSETAKSFVFNKKCLQSIFYNYCGSYVSIFLLLKSRGKSLNFILKLFKDPYKNDDLFKKLNKKYLS